MKKKLVWWYWPVIAVAVAGGIAIWNNPPGEELRDPTRPKVGRDGLAEPVRIWFQANLHDPKSLEVQKADPIYKSVAGSWGQVVEFRSKNQMGALALSRTLFLMDQDSVQSTETLSGPS